MKHNGSNEVPVIQIHDLSKSYSQANKTNAVLDHVGLDVHAGEFLVLLGVSGSGKSTLLNLISGIDNADSGQILIKGTDITTLSEVKRTLFRRDHIGIVFQFFNLIPTLTVLENITMPLDLRGAKRRETEKHGRQLLERVGLADRANDFPDKLSGGEQQRVAIARALIHEPILVLADEPTGNLDVETGKGVLDLLLELTRQAGKTLAMATHNPEIVPFADRVYRIQDGHLIMLMNEPRPLRPEKT
jgi:putative ABC transport system ATP-binding protein